MEKLNQPHCLEKEDIFCFVPRLQTSSVVARSMVVVHC